MHETDYGLSVGRLTADQLTTASHDLTNAGMVLRHAGHFKGALCDRNTGSVCAVGAIELATYKRIYTSPMFSYLTITQDNYWLSAAHNRAEAAIVVLAQVVPTGLCKECDDDKKFCECGYTCTGAPREAWEKVTHYNDAHCPGGTGAMEVMRMAAEHAANLAEEARIRNADLRVTV